MEHKNRILVVDDEQDLLEILKFNLETEGYEVSTACSAEEALTLNVGEFDLLLLDVMMGGMSGFAMAKKLKSDPATEHIPIVFLTARDTENDKDVLVLDRTVDVNITRLRKKIGRFSKCIVTRLGFGYYFDA